MMKIVPMIITCITFGEAHKEITEPVTRLDSAQRLKSLEESIDSFEKSTGASYKKLTSEIAGAVSEFIAENSKIINRAWKTPFI